MEVLNMKDMNFNGLDYIKADKKLIDSTVSKVVSGKKRHNYFNTKQSIAVAGSLSVIFSSAIFYSSSLKENPNNNIANKITVDSNATPNKIIPNNIATNDPVSGKATEDSSAAPNKSEQTPSIITNKNASSSTTTNSSVISKTPVQNHNIPAGNNSGSNSNPSKDIANNTGIYISPINLNPSNGTSAKMIALVVYNGKVYTQSATEIASNNIENFLGEKIGRTTNSINEWNVKDKSSEELASNIGEQDIYTVKGYDTNFRIMSYIKIQDQEYIQFFDCLNGITIKNGNDVFGKLNLVNNVESAEFISFDDWNNGVNNYATFQDLDILNEALIELNSATPYNYENVENDIDNSRNNNDFRQFALKLKDGSELKFNAFKSGYVSYGYSNIYFKVNASVIEKLWK